MGIDGLESAGSPGLVQIYTLRTHSVVRTLTFTSRVLSVRASPRLLIVALDAQAGPPRDLDHTIHQNQSIASITALLGTGRLQGGQLVMAWWLVAQLPGRFCSKDRVGVGEACLMRFLGAGDGV